MKYAWIDEHRNQYAVSRPCRVLGVSRSGYCQWRVRPPSPSTLANQALDAKVAVIHDVSRRSYGRPRIVQRQQGEVVSADREARRLSSAPDEPGLKRCVASAQCDQAHACPTGRIGPVAEHHPPEQGGPQHL
ncbi:hypothetical protein D3C71_1276600 [compost metagenome]